MFGVSEQHPDNHSNTSAIKVKRLCLQQQQIPQLLTSGAKPEICFVVCTDEQTSIINYHHNHGGDSLRAFFKPFMGV